MAKFRSPSLLTNPLSYFEDLRDLQRQPRTLHLAAPVVTWNYQRISQRKILTYSLAPFLFHLTIRFPVTTSHLVKTIRTMGNVRRTRCGGSTQSSRHARRRTSAAL